MSNLKVSIEPVEIGNTAYYTVSQFASIIKKSEQTVYHLIKGGNAIRKLRCIKLAGRPLIPVSELTEFPFTYPGPKASENTYHYDKNGNVIPDLEGGDKK